MIREVLVYPDRRLKQPAAPVTTFGPALRRLAEDLQDTARAYPRTVGLAATQIGAMWRVVLVDCTDHPKVPDPLGPLVLVNPVVVSAEGAETGREGCLSLPEITADVRRPVAIEVEAVDPEGAPLRFTAEGFEARVVLHEIDHLDGVLILDRVASLARDVFPRRSGRGRRSPGALLVERAATLARIAHAGQRYDGDDPYTAHLEEVVAALGEHGVDDPQLIAAAWLHDVVEDTPVDVEAITQEFGERIGGIVSALTVPDRPDQDAARRDSWTRIAATPAAVAVKLGDRVANVRRGGPKVRRYEAQHPTFRGILTAADAGGLDAQVARLWATLESALADAGGPDPTARR
ncbi:MAG: peptide deformylase [Thermoleophilia bacterium]|nr:peptide deformylase [Thermoleophilia bacterium]